MDARSGFLILSGSFHLVLTLILLAAEGRLRVRASLALLFGFNGMVAFLSLPAGQQAWVNAFDWPTGALLVDAGVLLSAGRLARWEKASGALVVGMLLVLPGLAFAPEPWQFVGLALADLTVYVGWSVGLVGTTLGYMQHPSRFHLAALFAFGPRAIEYAFSSLGSIVRDPRWIFLGQFAPWRAVILVLTVGFLFWALRRAREMTGTALATIIGAGFAFWYGARFVSPDLQVFVIFSTLLVWRPAFMLAAIGMSRMDDPVKADGRAVWRRITFAAGAGLAAFLLGRSLLVGPEFGAVLSIGGALLGYGAGILATHPTTPASLSAPTVAPGGLTQGERVLLALRGVVVEPGRDAPAAAGTPGLSQAAGVLGKHIPTIVRRLNDKAEEEGRGPLVIADMGGVVGIRQRHVPRYHLTPAGEEMAARLYAALDPGPPSVLGEDHDEVDGSPMR